jgi:hypothetical protein
MTIDRIDYKGNYSKDNCRWSTPTQQGRNKRNNRFLIRNGITKTLSEWSEITGIDSETISSRLNKGWPVEDSLTLEVSPFERSKKKLFDKI